jgi:two-component system, chemotaxis family, CheB/CheR fusion protein
VKKSPRTESNDNGSVDCDADAHGLPLPPSQDVVHAPVASKNNLLTDAESSASLAILFELFRMRAGTDFSCYKLPTLLRRITRRMNLQRIHSLAQYVRFLQANLAEFKLLYQDLLIGVTNFFRDPGLFDFLKEKAIPQLLQSRPPENPLRVWTPACSTGEESYSMAIVIQECLAEIPRPDCPKVQIFATGLD